VSAMSANGANGLGGSAASHATQSTGTVDARAERVDERRLADSGLAGDEHEAPRLASTGGELVLQLRQQRLALVQLHSPMVRHDTATQEVRATKAMSSAASGSITATRGGMSAGSSSAGGSLRPARQQNCPASRDFTGAAGGSIRESIPHEIEIPAALAIGPSFARLVGCEVRSGERRGLEPALYPVIRVRMTR
jgi:hypothetical protein